MTAKEFRMNQRAAFDQAEAGETVVITRKGKIYALKLLDLQKLSADDVDAALKAKRRLEELYRRSLGEPQQ